MSDIKELLRAVNEEACNSEPYSVHLLCLEAADAMEALEKERDDFAQGLVQERVNQVSFANLRTEVVDVLWPIDDLQRKLIALTAEAHDWPDDSPIEHTLSLGELRRVWALMKRLKSYGLSSGQRQEES